MLLADVFLEEFHYATVFPLASTATLPSMAGFGQNIILAVIIAIIAATLGHVFNWWVGTKAKEYAFRNQQISNTGWYQKTTTLYNKYFFFLLLFSWMPLFNFYTLVAGFLGTPIKKALPLLFVGQAMFFVATFFYS